jgi:hypothetical protein
MSLDATIILLTIAGMAALFGAVLRWRTKRNPPAF